MESNRRLLLACIGGIIAVLVVVALHDLVMASHFVTCFIAMAAAVLHCKQIPRERPKTMPIVNDEQQHIMSGSGTVLLLSVQTNPKC